MAQRINEDIRFYLPADPYYYKVDNLPLQDLLDNDVNLQDQIDALNVDATATLGRSGFTELQPFINGALPGTVSVRPGNFIGRVQRTTGGALQGSTVHRFYNGLGEIANIPTNINGGYNVGLNPVVTGPDNFVARTSVFNFLGGNIDIAGFDFTAFSNPDSTQHTPPLGRIDLIGITTVNGAMDDPYLPGNPTGSGQVLGDGYPKLAVVQGAGIVAGANNNVREVVIGEKYITVGAPQEDINDYGRDLDGNVVPNPTFGTLPSPDDVVNVCFADHLVNTALHEFAYRNENASFFLPIAYVYVPQSHVAGNPLPTQNLKDIRPFFRTAELSLAERQAAAASVRPSEDNPFITGQSLDARFAQDIARDAGSANIQAQIAELRSGVQTIQVERTVWLPSPVNFAAAVMWNNLVTYDITNKILAAHRSKPIVSVVVSMQMANPRMGRTNNGFLGIHPGNLGTNGAGSWLIQFGYNGEGISVQIPPGTGSFAPTLGGSGQITLVGAAAGEVLRVNAYIRGYTYLETVTLGGA